MKNRFSVSPLSASARRRGEEWSLRGDDLRKKKNGKKKSTTAIAPLAASAIARPLSTRNRAEKSASISLPPLYELPFFVRGPFAKELRDFVPFFCGVEKVPEREISSTPPRTFVTRKCPLKPRAFSVARFF